MVSRIPTGVDKLVIAVDGPAGAGKSTVARKLARVLHLQYLDTGAMYRALTLKALRDHVDLNDESKLSEMAESIHLDMVYNARKKPPFRVYMDGEDVSAAIRSREVSAHVSQVSSHRGVRREMVRKQRSIAGDKGVVVEGRDVGTVVFPKADIKFFLTASVRERARRRYREMKKEGYDVSMESIQHEMVKRDHQDATREVNPLKRAPDAVLIDTTGESVSQVVKTMLKLIQGHLTGLEQVW
jgi:cytidylate kinase